MAGRYTLTESAYAVLGVSKSAGDDEIRKAYRKKARETHPDVGGDATKFAEVQQAWELIGTQDARIKYDNEQRYAAANPTTSGYAASSSGPYATTIDFETFIRAAAAAAQQQQRGPAGSRPGYWQEFRPSAAWSFNNANARPAQQSKPVSWLAIATPALAFFFPIGGVVAGIVGLYQTRQGRRIGRKFAKWGFIASLIITVIYALPSLLRIIG